MLNPTRYLGVDVSKETLDVAFERRRWQFANSKEGRRKFIAQIKKLPGPIQVVCESTGPYHIPMCLALQEAAIAFTIANPAKIRFFGRSEGTIAKTDAIDATLIERFANSKRPLPDPPLCLDHLAINELLAHRSHIINAIKVFRTHKHQVRDEALLADIDHSIAALEKRLELAEEKLRLKIEATPAWKEKLDKLTAVEGVGFLTAVVMIAKMPELGSLNRGQCAALSGLAPYDDTSGKRQGKRSIQGGRHEVRTALYMAALSASNFNPVLKVFYQRLRAKKKDFKVAITAVMRKLIMGLR